MPAQLIVPVAKARLADPESSFAANEKYIASADIEMIHVTGQCTAGSGTLTLVQWDSTPGRWNPVDGDAATLKQITLDPTKLLDGRFGPNYAVGPGIYALVVEGPGGGPTLTGGVYIAQRPLSRYR